ncbi:TPA: hypothetical protein WHS16_001039 [Neisseria meningitidis]
MIESIEKPQESIRKNRNPHRVIPAQAGIQKHNAAGLYRKKQKPSPPSFPRRRESKNATQQEFIRKNRNPTDRHSRAGGNPETQRGRTLSEKTETPPTVIPAKAGIQQPKNHRNLSAKTETPPPSFPQKRESRPVGTETYRIKQFP